MTHQASLREKLEAYAATVAYEMFAQGSLKYERVREEVEIEHASCLRKICIDWPLPSSRIDVTTMEGQPRTFVPLWPMRKGQMLADLAVSLTGGKMIRLAARQESTRLTAASLTLAWNVFREECLQKVQAADLDELEKDMDELEKEVVREIIGIPDGPIDHAQQCVARIDEKIKSSKLPLDSAAMKRFHGFARFISKRRILWVELEARPGDHIQLLYSYKTRFAPEYDVSKQANRRRFEPFGTFKRFIGQEPSELWVPVSRHGLARSYHFYITAPDGCFVNTIAFHLKDELGEVTTEQFSQFAKGVVYQGADEAGGAYGHLYCYLLPSEPGKRVYVKVGVMERPPGTTAPVAWLCTVAFFLSLLVYFKWNGVMGNQQFDAAKLLLAIPALASLWFNRAFQVEGRTRLPLATRGGLTSVAIASLYAIGVGVARSAGCSSQNLCLGQASFLVERSWFLVAVVALGITTTAVWAFRWHVHAVYRRCQRKVQAIYGQ